jgi:hypothetical protein
VIFLDAAFYFLCEMEAVHDTVFFNEHGVCVAMCNAGSSKVHACVDKYGTPLTDCIDDRGRQQTLCSAAVYKLTEDDYYIGRKK